MTVSSDILLPTSFPGPGAGSRSYSSVEMEKTDLQKSTPYDRPEKKKAFENYLAKETQPRDPIPKETRRTELNDSRRTAKEASDTSPSISEKEPAPKDNDQKKLDTENNVANDTKEALPTVPKEKLAENKSELTPVQVSLAVPSVDNKVPLVSTGPLYVSPEQAKVIFDQAGNKNTSQTASSDKVATNTQKEAPIKNTNLQGNLLSGNSAIINGKIQIAQTAGQQAETVPQQAIKQDVKQATKQDVSLQKDIPALKAEISTSVPEQTGNNLPSPETTTNDEARIKGNVLSIESLTEQKTDVPKTTNTDMIPPPATEVIISNSTGSEQTVLTADPQNITPQVISENSAQTLPSIQHQQPSLKEANNSLKENSSDKNENKITGKTGDQTTAGNEKASAESGYSGSNTKGKKGSSQQDAYISTNNGDKTQNTATAQNAPQNNLPARALFQVELGPILTSSGEAKTALPNGQISQTGLFSLQEAGQINNLAAASQIKAKTPHINPQMIAGQIGMAIAKQVDKGLSSFRISLKPAELGQVDIRMDFQADGRVHTTVVIENERTLNLLQRDQAALQKALENAGFNADGNNLNFSLKQQRQDQNGTDFTNNPSDGEEGEMLPPLNNIVTQQNLKMAYSNNALDINI